MTFLQRLLVLAFVPVAALLLVQSFYPSLLQEIPLYSTFFADSLPPRSETPLIVSAVPHWSHFEKIAKIATVLAELGYPITFITGHVFEKDVEKLHPLISFKPIQGKLDKLTAEEYKILETLVPGSQEQELFMMKKGMLDNIPDQYATLQEAFSEFRDKHGHDKPLLSLYDTLFEGHHPVSLAAPGLKPDTNIGLACHPMTVDSNDTLPFYIGKPPLQSPDAKAVHHKANQAGEQGMDWFTREMTKAYWAKMQSVGSTIIHDWHFYAPITALPEYLMMLGVPEFEFPRSDLRSNVHYFGGWKTQAVAKKAVVPEWWDDIAAAKKEGKQIVAVSQGTLDPDLTHLLLPTLEALKDRTDVLIVATTVAVEVEDVPDLVVPGNTRIAKFAPYDLLLPLTDILVNNGGYGAVIQSLQAGVPMVVAGKGQDKAVTNAIIDWKEVGVNLGRQDPSVDEVREGIVKVLEDKKYKRNAVAIKDAFETYDMSVVFDRVIQGVVRDWVREKRSR